MVTICELKIELKKKGIKGITGLRKAELEALLDGYVPFTGKTPPAPKAKPAPKTKPAPKAKPAPKKTEPAPKPAPKKTEPLKLLKFTEKVDEPSISDKPPTLSNKSLDELYVKIVSLEKRLKDDINPNEKNVTETTLEKYKTAYRYVRKQFMDSIKKMSKAELKKLNKSLEKKYKNSTDDDANTIFEGQFREINKLL